jgi:hypothetical protein
MFINGHAVTNPKWFGIYVEQGGPAVLRAGIGDLIRPEARPFLRLTCPTTGAQVVIPAPENLPEGDVPCPCGNPNHLAIGYGPRA